MKTIPISFLFVSLMGLTAGEDLQKLPLPELEQQVETGRQREPSLQHVEKGKFPAKNDPDYGRLYSENHICMVQCVNCKDT